MNLPVLFDSIILNAQGARTCYFNGQEDEAFVKLEQCQRTIAALRDFREKVHALLNDDPTPMAGPGPPTRGVPSKGRGGKTANLAAAMPPAPIGPPKVKQQLQQPRPPSSAGLSMAAPPAKRPARPGSNDFGDDLNRPGSLPVSPFQTGGDISDDENITELEHGAAAALDLVPDVVKKLDDIFFAFLARICSDLDAMDSAGEKLHQTQTAKRLLNVSESDYNSFKFRIRPFINAFKEELELTGFGSEVLPERLLKIYLAQQRYISRFNEDGRKAKSKGTHVWIIEAKKTADGAFMFREFERKIVGPEPPTVAQVGTRFRYEPRIFDPQTSNPRVRFQSPDLPAWLRWEGNVLTGIVPHDAIPFDVHVQGVFQAPDDCTLEKVFHVDIAPWDPTLMGGPMSPMGGMFMDPNGVPYSPNGTFVVPQTPSEMMIPTIAVELAPKGNRNIQQRKPSGMMPQGPFPQQGHMQPIMVMNMGMGMGMQGMGMGMGHGGVSGQRPMALPGRVPTNSQQQMLYDGAMDFPTPGSMSANNAPVGVKRKRGRPPNAVKNQQQQPPQQQQQQQMQHQQQMQQQKMLVKPQKQLKSDFGSGVLYSTLTGAGAATMQMNGQNHFMGSGHFSDEGDLVVGQHPDLLNGYDDFDAGYVDEDQLPPQPQQQYRYPAYAASVAGSQMSGGRRAPQMPQQQAQYANGSGQYFEEDDYD